MTTTLSDAPPAKAVLRDWLMDPSPGERRESVHDQDAGHAWWKAAGLLSPIATLILVAVTLFGALPVYRRVAEESPHGQGSIAMLERLLPFWRGKIFALGLHGQALWLTLGTLALLGAVFPRGFREAIGLAVVLVGVYLALNAAAMVVLLWEVASHPSLVPDWSSALVESHGDPVMPHVRGATGDTEERPTGRIRGTKRLLTTAAVIMSVFPLRHGVRRLHHRHPLVRGRLRHGRDAHPDSVLRHGTGVGLGHRSARARPDRSSVPHHLDLQHQRRCAGGGAYATAERFVRDCARRTIRLVANEPDGRDPQEYADKERQIRRDHDLPSDEDLIFVEVTVTDPAEFENAQEVHGTVMHGRYRVLALESSSVPKALAALAKFLLFGVGEIAPTTREVLRRAEPDRQRRPHVHVG